MLEPEIKERFVELRSQGMSFSTIAERLCVAKSTLIDWSKEFQEDIKNFRQIHLEAMREKYRVGFERRIELFGQQLQTIETELSKRDLTQLPTERLIDLLLKFGRELKTDDVPLTFCQKSSGFDLDLDRISVSKWEA
ncbi:MAG: hypothetical protein V1716_02655 [Candidatus Uhrbacteria bacterium]